MTKVDQLREILIAIDSLLNWAFLSGPTRQQLETFRSELEDELRSALAEGQSGVAAAS